MQFVLVAMQAIDVICAEVMKMDVKQVIAKRIRSYHAGWGEPSFLSTGIPQLNSNWPITDTWRFMYSRQNMEGLDYKNDDLKLHAKLLKIYQEVLNSNMTWILQMIFREWHRKIWLGTKTKLRKPEWKRVVTNLSEFCKKCFPCLYRNKSEEPRTKYYSD